MTDRLTEIAAKLDELGPRVIRFHANHKQIETPEQAATAAKLRIELAALKDAAEDARDAERLPLVEAAQAVQARYAPKLARIKQIDDLVRHQLRAWSKRSYRP